MEAFSFVVPTEFVQLFDKLIKSHDKKNSATTSDMQVEESNLLLGYIDMSNSNRPTFLQFDGTENLVKETSLGRRHTELVQVRDSRIIRKVQIKKQLRVLPSKKSKLQNQASHQTKHPPIDLGSIRIMPSISSSVDAVPHIGKPRKRKNIQLTSNRKNNSTTKKCPRNTKLLISRRQYSTINAKSDDKDRSKRVLTNKGMSKIVKSPTDDAKSAVEKKDTGRSSSITQPTSNSMLKVKDKKINGSIKQSTSFARSTTVEHCIPSQKIEQQKDKMKRTGSTSRPILKTSVNTAIPAAAFHEQVQSILSKGTRFYWQL